MLFHHSLRFKGYWLSLFSWIILSFAAPASNALAESELGWMRLCSAHGVQWVQTTSASDANTGADCVCLSLALSYHNAVPAKGVSEPGLGFFSGYETVALVVSYSPIQPRSPPVISS